MIPKYFKALRDKRMTTNNKSHWAIKGIDEGIRKEITDTAKRMEISIGEYINKYIYPVYAQRGNKSANKDLENRLYKIEATLLELAIDKKQILHCIGKNNTNDDLVKTLADVITNISQYRK